MSALRVAVTGGIGSGKSTVGRMLADRGAHLVDADAIAREVVAAGSPGLAALVDQFGHDILDSAGALDRPRLARLVFSDPAARAQLEAVIHPLVRELSQRRLAAVPAGEVAVYDVPLLAEAPGGRAGFDVVVVVTATPDTRMARLADRGMTGADARARIAAQADDSTRAALADVVISNNGTVAQLEPQVQTLWHQLRVRAAREPGGPGSTAPATIG